MPLSDGKARVGDFFAAIEPWEKEYKQNVVGFFAMAKVSKKVLRKIEKQAKPMSEALMDQAKNFYMAVGQGISHWSKMEGRLVQVVAKLLRTTEPKAGLVMYSIINLHSWIAIIDELFELDNTYPKSAEMWAGIARLPKKGNR